KTMSDVCGMDSRAPVGGRGICCPRASFMEPPRRPRASRFSPPNSPRKHPRGNRLLPQEGLWRELVLDDELHDDLVTRLRQAEARPEGELQPSHHLPVERREDVVLLRLGGFDIPDLTDVAEELERGLKRTGQSIVDASGVVELHRPPFLAHRRQLEGRVQVDREAPEVARNERTELELEIRLLVVRHFRLEVPAEVDGEATLVPQRPADAEARGGVL